MQEIDNIYLSGPHLLSFLRDRLYHPIHPPAPETMQSVHNLNPAAPHSTQPLPREPTYVDPTHNDEKPNEQRTRRPSTAPTDEGYDSDGKCDDVEDEKPPEPKPAKEPREVPIMKSTCTIRVSYTRSTYILTFLIIGLYLHSLLFNPSHYLFPNLFNLFNIAFHVTHLTAHTLHLASVERVCVAYGTWTFWIGWVLGTFVFRHNIPIDLTHPTTILFWALMFNRRNAWGIIMWEHLTRLEEDDGFDVESSRWHDRDRCGGLSSGSGRVIAYRLWCLAGVGSMWGLIYLLVARCDGLHFVEALGLVPVLKIYLFNLIAGIMLICWWSFWTFQYRGIVWRKDLQDGIIVWFSEGYIRAGEVQ